MQEVDGLLKVHHIHAWSITQERPMATLEAGIAKDADAKLVKDEIKKILRNQFGIEHSTIEISRK